MECNSSKVASQILESSQIDTFPHVLFAYFVSRNQLSASYIKKAMAWNGLIPLQKYTNFLTCLVKKIQIMGRLQHFQGHCSKFLAICLFFALSNQRKPWNLFWKYQVLSRCVFKSMQVLMLNITFYTNTTLNILVCKSNNHDHFPCIRYQIRNLLHQIKDWKIYHFNLF